MNDAPPASYLLRPQPEDPRLTRRMSGLDQEGKPVETAVVVERPLTLFLNGQEIVTMMTIGDYPDYLAVGYLINQNMLTPEDRIAGIDYDEELETVVVRTERATSIRPSGRPTRPSDASKSHLPSSENARSALSSFFCTP